MVELIGIWVWTGGLGDGLFMGKGIGVGDTGDGGGGWVLGFGEMVILTDDGVNSTLLWPKVYETRFSPPVFDLAGSWISELLAEYELTNYEFLKLVFSDIEFTSAYGTNT